MDTSVLRLESMKTHELHMLTPEAVGFFDNEMESANCTFDLEDVIIMPEVLFCSTLIPLYKKIILNKEKYKKCIM